MLIRKLTVILFLALIQTTGWAYPRGSNGSVVNESEVTVFIIFRNEYGTEEVSLPPRSSTDISDGVVSLKCNRNARVHQMQDISAEESLRLAIYHPSGQKTYLTEWGKSAELQTKLYF